MSLDARYILNYDTLPYVPPTPQQKDKEYLLAEIKTLEEEDFITLEEGTIFFAMPKYKLLKEHLDKLLADRVLEREDCQLWKIIK